MSWRGSRGRLWAVTTEPVAHQGRFHDMKLLLNQCVFAVLPSAKAVVPSMILQFEMLLLPGEHSHVSAVVGWGAFPVCDCGFNIIQGKFKAPLLRGLPNPALNQFRRIEALMASDLDSWLCNLYFQVKKLPEGHFGLKHSATLQNPCEDCGHAVAEHAELTGDTFPVKAEAGTHCKDTRSGKTCPKRGMKKRSAPLRDEQQDRHPGLCSDELEEYNFSLP
ncbi:hypothetical protein GN956_G19850 [Arapaima gigas]